MATQNPRPASTLSWIALTIAVIALIISVVTYQRQVQADRTFVSRELQAQINSLRQQEAVSRASRQLQDIRTSISGGTNPQMMQTQIAEIRTNLAFAFQNAGQKAQSSWKAIDDELAAFVTTSKQGTVTILATLDRVIRNLEQQMQYD